MSRTPEEEERRSPQLGDTDYDIRAFGSELAGGGLRWFATVLAILNAGLLAYLATRPDDAAIYWPIRLSGKTAFVALCVTLVVWTGLALLNWVFWLRARRD